MWPSTLDKDEEMLLLEHFPEQISEELDNYVTNIALKSSRYLFVSRNKKTRLQLGYCTHCREYSRTEGLKHNDKAKCPKCESMCTVKSSGRGRGKMYDEAYIIWYEKSLKNPQAITARGLHVVRDYREDYKSVETKFRVTALYIFEPNNTVMYVPSYWNSMWNKKATVHFENNSIMQNKRYMFFQSTENIMKAVKGTPFQYSTWEQYADEYLVKFFDMAAKYPCVEFLTKLGLGELIEAKLYGRSTYNAINWRGNTMEKILRLSKSDIKELRVSTLQVYPLLLKLFQISKKDGSHLTVDEIQDIAHSYGWYFSDFKPLLKHTTLRKLDTFIKKQYKKKDSKSIYYGGQHNVITTWRDYLADCKRLEMDLTNESVLFPSNLYRAHQNTIKQVKLKEDEELNKKISSRLRVLDKFRFEYAGLILRPASSSKELIEEGKALNHCVGTYADKYAKGETNLFVLRKIGKPNEPYFTVEIKSNKIAQVRGKKNCAPTKEVQAFIDKFADEKLAKKSRKTKIAQPA